MIIMIDCHTHTYYSHDSTQDPKETIPFAIEKGLEYLAFTDHCDKDCLFNPAYKDKIRQIDLDSCFKELRFLQEQYKGKIELAVGLECGYMKQATPMYEKILKDYPTDITINSVHLVDFMDCYYREFFERKTKLQAYGQYVQAIYDSLFVPYHYDIVAHIGYVVRKAPYEDKSLNYSDFPDLFDSILKTIIEKGKALEVNTHAENTGFYTLPNPVILKRYKELGGELLTIATDAHKKEKLGFEYDNALSYLKDLNFKYLFKYLNHTPIAVKI
jgi:histidinol-phosphatase (PHP family)